MKNDLPLVSVITPCYNGEKFVHRFLDSVLAQTYKNIELIFINDGSTDKTEQIVLGYKPLFEMNGIEFIYISQENKGQSVALDQGLKIFKGEFITWPDSDDILYPENISRKVEILSNNSNASLVICGADIVYEEELDKIVGTYKRDPTLSSDLLLDLLTGNNIYYAPIMYMARACAFIKAYPSREVCSHNSKIVGQNLQLLIPLSYSQQFECITESLAKYLIRAESHSHEEQNFKQFLERCESKLEIIIEAINKIKFESNEEKTFYINQASKDTFAAILRASFDCKDSIIYKTYFNKLKILRSPTFTESVRYLLISSSLLYKFNLLLRKIFAKFRETNRRKND